MIDAELAGGEFARQESRFRDWVGPDPRTGATGEHQPEAGRYHLYVSLACPWCHRTAIVRELAGLQQALPISYLAPFRDERGWAFTGERFADGPAGEYVDALHGWAFMSEAYSASDPSFGERITVPVLWDTRTERIVNNESSDMIRMMGSADSLGGLGHGAELDLYPEELRAEIDTINERVVRFDEVYNLHFRCNRRRLVDYPNLWGYARELHQLPGVAGTVAMDQIKRHYYTTHDELNPKRIIPVGPGYDWAEPHGRDR